jgi:hypothetical protein
MVRMVENEGRWDHFRMLKMGYVFYSLLLVFAHNTLRKMLLLFTENKSRFYIY